ncbi:MAG: MarR family winged helix-turn-helix transcriptional regulator, partial [Acidimicrobiales bacterium]
ATAARRREAEAFACEYPGSSLLASRALRELEIVGGKAEALVAGVARRYALSHAALNALAVIEGEGGPIAAGEVSARMHITTGTMTSVLDTLERNGYVESRADPGDRRRVLVDITPAAEDVLDRVLPEVQQVVSVAMGVLDDDALQAFIDTLGVIRAAIAAVPEELPAATRRRTPQHLRRAPTNDPAPRRSDGRTPK